VIWFSIIIYTKHTYYTKTHYYY